MGTSGKQMENQEKYTNALIHESSPYLLQHAHNPVDWMPWGEAALKKAKEEDKPLLISIGYSACHWCHVMEEESFEDTAVAKLMNENFVCIKVDREERPDIDQIYISAVQLMTGSGGWPLNCFATPDGKPFYGGTYFPKVSWIDILEKITKLYQNEREKVLTYADNLTEGVRTSELIERNTADKPFVVETLQGALDRWKSAFDTVEGGNNQAPKFPMPNNYQFLLNYNYLFPTPAIEKHIETTLKKMAYGGIYDQIGGGFSRYSTDMEWKAPHFEKMLYDNAQLISLYSEAFRWSKNPLYSQIVKESIAFVERELKDESGAFYSALDADSEGEEGKYYVWTKADLKEVLGADYSIAKDYFNVNEKGFWEGNYILLRNEDNEALASAAGMSLLAYQAKVEEIKRKLLKNRESRIKPGLDDKSLTSWNALMLKALCDAYLSFGKEEYLKMAIDNANFLIKNQLKDDGSLYRSYKDGKSSINGYLKDYSFTIEAFIALYQVTFDEKWLEKADDIAAYAIKSFFDEATGMFYFTSVDDPDLIARKMEVMDNVIPASNSSMAKGLHQLGLLYDKGEYLEKSKQMLLNMQEKMTQYMPGVSNWGILMLRHFAPYYELAIVGEKAIEQNLVVHQDYIPNKMVLGQQKKQSDIPLLEMKWVDGQTTFYVCENKVCQKPLTDAAAAVNQMSSHK